jgi:rRNA-processing protein FCF1
MIQILCDTDFLIKVTTEPLPAVASFLDDSGFELVTLAKVQEELRGLTQSRNQSTARKAKLALGSLATGAVKILKSPSPKGTDADILLLEFAANSKRQTIIASLDHTLLSILEKRKLPYLTLRKNRPFFRSFESATYLLEDRP